MMSAANIPTWLHLPLETSMEKLAHTPSWFADFRQQQWQAFLAHGLPTRKNERYKYADLAFLTQKQFSPAVRADAEQLHDAIQQHRLQRDESILLAFVNGHFMPELSDLQKLPANVIACQLSTALTEHADLVTKYWPEKMNAQKYPFACLNAAMGTNGLFFYLPDHCQLNIPLHLLSIVTDENEFIAYPQHLFVLGNDSKLTIAEEYFSHATQTYMINHVSHISLQANAQLNHYKIQNESKHAIHMAHIFLTQQQNSFAAFTNFSFGGQFSRDDLIVSLQATGAECKAAGFYHLQEDQQYMDHHVDIHHVAERSQSEMLYKGILAKKSRAVFNGRVLVEKDAQKILAHQANHNLLLSDAAEIYSKPELEIYADDVKCKHGATIGQLDQDALFYMRARGISKHEAIQILLQGFAEDILHRIDHVGIKLRVLELMS